MTTTDKTLILVANYDRPKVRYAWVTEGELRQINLIREKRGLARLFATSAFTPLLNSLKTEGKFNG